MSDVAQLIKLGEGKTVEFKVDFPKNDQIVKTVIAFANSSGGRIFVGVDDFGRVIGFFDDVPNTIAKIANIVHDSVVPVIAPEIYLQTVEGKPVLVIEVPRGTAKPYCLKTKSLTDGVFIRIGSTNKLANGEFVRELDRQRRNVGFDEDFDSEYSVDLSGKLKEIFGRGFSKPIEEALLDNFHLRKKQGSVYLYANAARIICGDLPGAVLKCARFLGNEKTEFVDRKEYSGNIFEQIDDALLFLQNHLFLSGKISGVKRQDKLEIPLVALREAVVNAVLHRDYSIRGADIKIAVYDDYVEILSPGELPNSLTVTDLFQGRSEIRNMILARVLKQAEYIEQWGSGVSRMVAECLAVRLPAPQIAEIGRFVSVKFARRKTIHDSNPSSDVVDNVVDNVVDVVDIQRIILAAIAITPEISAKELSEKTGMTQRNIQRHIKILRESKQIERLGPPRGGKWIVKS